MTGVGGILPRPPLAGVMRPPPLDGLVIRSKALTGKHLFSRNPKDGYGFRSGGWIKCWSFLTPYLFGQAKVAGFPSVGRSRCDRGWI